MKDSLYLKTIEHLKKINSIPSSPFAVSLQVKFLEETLKQLGYEYDKSEYSLIVRVQPKVKNTKKLVLMTHLDHPGAVFDGQGGGVFFGSVGLERVERAIQESLFLRVYSTAGEYLGKGKISGLAKQKQNFYFESDFSVPRNSSGCFDIEEFSEDERHLRVYNSDNGIDTACMLALLSLRPETVYDTYFVFNIHEEVHQISAWELAKNNHLNVGRDDLILNLESPIIETNVTVSGPRLTYDDGVVLKLSNLGCLFGGLVPGANMIEKVVRHVANKSKIELQLGFAKGSDESRCFSSFTFTGNIATLAIPNKFKHNWGTNDEFVAEEIKVQDVKDFGRLVQAVLETEISAGEIEMVKSLAEEQKENDVITDSESMRKKAILNDRLDIRYRSVLKRGYYFPVKLTDYFKDWFGGLISYIYYIWQQIWS